MKLTKSKLRQLIREELQATSEGLVPVSTSGPGMPGKTPEERLDKIDHHIRTLYSHLDAITNKLKGLGVKYDG